MEQLDIPTRPVKSPAEFGTGSELRRKGCGAGETIKFNRGLCGSPIGLLPECGKGDDFVPGAG